MPVSSSGAFRRTGPLHPHGAEHQTEEVFADGSVLRTVEKRSVQFERACGFSGAVCPNVVGYGLEPVGVDVVTQSFQDAAPALVHEKASEPCDPAFNRFSAAFLEDRVVVQILRDSAPHDGLGPEGRLVSGKPADKESNDFFPCVPRRETGAIEVVEGEGGRDLIVSDEPEPGGRRLQNLLPRGVPVPVGDDPVPVHEKRLHPGDVVAGLIQAVAPVVEKIPDTEPGNAALLFRTYRDQPPGHRVRGTSAVGVSPAWQGFGEDPLFRLGGFGFKAFAEPRIEDGTRAEYTDAVIGREVGVNGFFKGKARDCSSASFQAPQRSRNTGR